MDLRNAAQELQRLGEDTGWDIPATQKAFFESEIQSYRRGVVLQEELHVLFLPAPDHKLAAAIVFHRDPPKREKAGIVIVERTGRPTTAEKSFAELPQVLAQYGDR